MEREYYFFEVVAAGFSVFFRKLLPVTAVSAVVAVLHIMILPHTAGIINILAQMLISALMLSVIAILVEDTMLEGNTPFIKLLNRAGSRIWPVCFTMAMLVVAYFAIMFFHLATRVVVAATGPVLGFIVALLVLAVVLATLISLVFTPHAAILRGQMLGAVDYSIQVVADKKWAVFGTVLGIALVVGVPLVGITALLVIARAAEELVLFTDIMFQSLAWVMLTVSFVNRDQFKEEPNLNSADRKDRYDHRDPVMADRFGGHPRP